MTRSCSCPRLGWAVWPHRSHWPALPRPARVPRYRPRVAATGRRECRSVAAFERRGQAARGARFRGPGRSRRRRARSCRRAVRAAVVLRAGQVATVAAGRHGWPGRAARLRREPPRFRHGHGDGEHDRVVVGVPAGFRGDRRVVAVAAVAPAGAVRGRHGRGEPAAQRAGEAGRASVPAGGGGPDRARERRELPQRPRPGGDGGVRGAAAGVSAGVGAAVVRRGLPRSSSRC